MPRVTIFLVAGVLVLVSGCGGGGKTEKAAPLQVAALGDSITAGSPMWDPDPAVRAQLGDSLNPQSQFEYWAERSLGGRAKVRIRNCGVFGQRTDEIAARLGRCARGAKVLVVQGGINDLAQGGTPESAATKLLAMVKRGKALGLRVLLAQVLPWNQGYPQAAPRIERLNRLIGQIGRDENVRVLAFYKALEDPDRPGRMPSGLTLDDTHPDVPGYRIMGELLAKELRAAQDASS